jgi:hypothetical protein
MSHPKLHERDAAIPILVRVGKQDDLGHLDECDACLCALVALTYGYGGQIEGLPTMQAPTGAIADIKREGWIFYSASDWSTR